MFNIFSCYMKATKSDSISIPSVLHKQETELVSTFIKYWGNGSYMSASSVYKFLFAINISVIHQTKDKIIYW